MHCEATVNATEDENGRPVEWLTPINNYVNDEDHMVLKASYDATNNRYQGTEICTNDYYSYGYYEIRAKVNVSQGICAAFWLCGSRDAASKIEYELDMFECFGSFPTVLKHTALAHYYPNGSTGEKQSTQNLHNNVEELTSLYKTEYLSSLATEKKLGTGYIDGKSFFDVGTPTEWHTYGLDWRKDSITWYIDGVATMKLDIPEEGVTGANTRLQYFYNEPMQLRLSVYCDRDVAGLTGQVGETTDWENGSSMVIDYVRIYQYD